MTTTDASGARRVTRWLSTAGFVLTGLFLLLPFATVSCDAPGGFGRAAPGGTTTYSGVALLTGAAPAVDPPAKLRPRAEQRDDKLGVQPLAIALALLILAGVVASANVFDPLRRRVAGAVIGAAAAVFLVANQLTVKSLLQSRLREQLSAPLPAGKQASDYIHDQGGFWLCLFTLLALTAANGIGWFRVRRHR